jgi:hypothetical protein
LRASFGLFFYKYKNERYYAADKLLGASLRADYNAVIAYSGFRRIDLMSKLRDFYSLYFKSDLYYFD